MHALMLHNDQIRPVSDLALSAGQTGLLNGWGVFSTIRVYDGVMFCWPRHFARMQHDARLMHVPFPSDASWLEARLLKLLDANHAHNATLRVAIVRNRGGMFQGDNIERDFDLIAFTAQVNNWGTSVRLGLVPHGRHAANEFAGVKYLSWAQNLTWYERAHDQGLDEVVLLNERGEVAECTSANIFAAFKTNTGVEVRTPPLSAGCLPGVTRALLLEEIQVPGIRVVEATLMPADLEHADEVFITSTTRELLPVVEITGLHLQGSGQSQPSSCDQLVLGLKSYVHQYVSTKPHTTSV